MGQPNKRKSSKYRELAARGWTEIEVPFVDVNGIRERNIWARQQFGIRGGTWDAVHIKSWFFANPSQAIMFKLRYGGVS